MNGGTHDMGFKMYCSFGNGYRLTQDERYKEILLQSARTLSTRFKPKAGIIRSWDHNKDKWQCPVIIDNMMNLELLFWATKESKDSTYYNIAVSHARTTMKNHFRADYSCYHVIDYDTITGQVLKRTHIRDLRTNRLGHAVRHGHCMAIRCVTGKPSYRNSSNRLKGGTIPLHPQKYARRPDPLLGLRRSRHSQRAA